MELREVQPLHGVCAQSGLAEFLLRDHLIRDRVHIDSLEHRAPDRGGEREERKEHRYCEVKVCTDINTLTSYTTTKQKEFSKNRVMRVLNQYCNDVYKECAENYIGGGMNNNKSGRDLFKGWIIGYLNELQANNGIKNFVADDVTVAEGNATDAITVTAYIQPVDSIEKIYMTVPVTRSSATTE